MPTTDDDRVLVWDAITAARGLLAKLDERGMPPTS